MFIKTELLSGRGMIAAMVSALAMSLAMVVLDLVWLGVVGREFYRSQMGALMRLDVYVPAAVLFYTMYLTAMFFYAVLGARGKRDAFLRGAALGLVCYATYDLTNWAVIQNWPALLVPVDIAWGVVLTGSASGAGRLVYNAVFGKRSS